MNEYVCEPCGYVYDPEVGDPDNGIEPGTAFRPICRKTGSAHGAEWGKEVFVEEN